MAIDSASLIRKAREAAGLTQRGLAERLGTSQSAIARWEGGGVSPTVSALDRALNACGYEAQIVVRTYVDPDEWSQVQNLRAMTPEERLANLTQAMKSPGSKRRQRSAS
jgi:transcriptional regulator with XRE-family HTH domain